jgi:hypothetical protein
VFDGAVSSDPKNKFEAELGGHHGRHFPFTIGTSCIVPSGCSMPNE